MPAITPSLDGALAQLARAREHIVDLIAKTALLREKQEKSCSWEWNTDDNHIGEPKLVVSGSPDIPPVVGVVIGKTIYNLRSALDYLVYELAILDSGRVVNGTSISY